MPVMHLFDVHCAEKEYVWLHLLSFLFIDGWQHWSIPLTVGSKWADASASDVGCNRLTRKITIATRLS